MGVRLQLLGVPKGEVGGVFSDLPLDKPASLLYYLAQRSDWIGRAELAFLYRPDVPEEIALANVRKFIHRAKEFAWAEGLEVEKFRVRFAPSTDVQMFNQALEQQDWARALQLYRGSFLEGLHLLDVEGYETWLELEREQLTQKWRTAILERVKQLEENFDPASAEGWLERLLKTDPLDEEALQSYLRVLHQGGKRAQMIEAYEAFCQELKGELGVEPLATTKVLLENLRSREPQPAKSRTQPLSPQPVAPKPTHNLPVQTTRFVGRQPELEQLSKHLAQADCRLLTLMGLGGMGKTRLGLELAQQQLEAFQHGVWFVPLVGVASAQMLVSSIAAAIGLGFSGDEGPQAQLLNYLRHKQILLLLDSFEHLVEGAVLLEQLLEEAPGLKLLVTSRVALELSSEQIFDLEGLAYPTLNTQEPLESFDSVRLFINRAERLSKTFVAQGATLETVAALCRKVQGMPLAVELTATWTRSVGVTELLASLERGFDLLTTTQRDVPERHRNLQAVLDYTWKHLSAAEQNALIKLSLFRGGFTLEAAEKIAQVHLSLLLRLINQALIRRNQDGRYDMHELVRQYAQGFLQGPAQQALEKAFCQHYLQLLAHNEAELRGGRQLEVKQQLLDEIENLRQVLHLAQQHSLWAELESAFTALHLLLRDLGYFQEGRSVFAAIRQGLSGQAPGQERLLAKAQLRQAIFERYLEPFAVVEPLLLEAIQKLRELNVQDDLALALQVLGGETRAAGYVSKAEPLILESCALSKNLPDPYLYAVCLLSLSNLLRDQGRLVEATELAEQSLNIRRPVGDIRGIAMVTAHLANLARDQGDLFRAKTFTTQSLETKRQLGDLRQVSRELGNLAIYAFEEGNLEESEQLLLESLNLKEKQGDYNSQTITLSNLAEIYREQGQYARAHELFSKALSQAQRFNMVSHKALILVEMGENFRREGQFSAAVSHLLQALHIAYDHQVPARIALTGLYYLARVRAQDSHLERAYELAAFVSSYAATLQQTREWAWGLCVELESKLSPQVIASLKQRVAAWSFKEALKNQFDPVAKPGG